MWPRKAARPADGAHTVAPITDIEPRKRRAALNQWLLFLAAFLAVSVPTVVAVRMAQNTSLAHQKERVASMAQHVLDRAERISRQLEQTFADLGAETGSAPCSETSLAAMRRAVVKSNMLLDVGYVQDDVLVCSALGRQQLPVGKTSYTTRLGYAIRPGVPHPLLREVVVLVSTEVRSGYSGIVHTGTLMDEVPADSPWNAGLIGISREKPLMQRGEFDPQWLTPIGEAQTTSFEYGEYIVAWQRSSRYDYAVYAALPRSAMQDDSRRTLMVLLPLGLLGGLLLAFVTTRIVRMRTSTLSLLKSGIRGNGLFLAYQPIVDMKTGRWVGAEALVRWRLPSGEIVSPCVFIPLAERHQLIGLITARVVALVEQEVLPVLQSDPAFYISINVSADDICGPSLMEHLNQAVVRLGVTPKNFHIEATEGIFMRVEEARHAVRALRVQGFKVALDDFGTGYSSLSYLTSMELDYLKIDKSFVDTIGTEAITSQVLHHIIELAKSLNLRMVAEGVETPEQADYLRLHGVEFAQGWLYARPLEINALRAGLASATGT
jgi:sensor c-di-GMP phosphodiesterase-like protein